MKYKTPTSVYSGQFHYGLKQGKGKFTYPSGDYYSGFFQNDKKNGYGKMNWKSTSEIYKGCWVNGVQNGWGIHLWFGEKKSKVLRANKYQGVFKNGTRETIGGFFYSNGSKYEGQWTRNKKNGLGRYQDCNGNSYWAFWKDDKLGRVILGKPIQLDSTFLFNEELTPNEKFKNPYESVLGLEEVQDKDQSKSIYDVFVRHNNMLTSIFQKLRGESMCHTESVYTLRVGILWEFCFKAGCFTPKRNFAEVVQLWNRNKENFIDPDFEPASFRREIEEMVKSKSLNGEFTKEEKEEVEKCIKDTEYASDLLGKCQKLKKNKEESRELPQLFIFFKGFLSFLLCLGISGAKHHVAKELDKIFTSLSGISDDEISIEGGFMEPVPSQIPKVFHQMLCPMFSKMELGQSRTGFVRDMVTYLKKAGAFKETEFIRALGVIWQSEKMVKVNLDVLNYSMSIFEFSLFLKKYCSEIGRNIEDFVVPLKHGIGDPVCLRPKRKLPIEEFNKEILPEILKEEGENQKRERMLMGLEDTNIQSELEREERGKKKKKKKS